MKKRYLDIKPTLENANTDQLFTALIKKLQKENPNHCYFVDSSSLDPYPTWSMYHVANGHTTVAKEIKQ